MDQNTPPPASNEVPPEFDRRGANRAASTWVRVSLQQQTEKIDKIAAEVHEISTILSKTIPDANWEKHRESHVTYKEWEIERAKQEAERIEREQENRKFRESLKRDFIKWGMGAVGLFLVGVFFTGIQSKVRDWAIIALTQEQPRLEIKK
jgi:hypothetical protein